MSYYQTNNKVIKNKVGLLNLAQELGNIAQACKMMGFSRDTFYRYKKAVDEGGVETLIDRSRRVPNFKNRVDPAVEDAVIELAIDEPAWGQLRASNELRKRGIIVSHSGVRSIWMRNNLENMKKRLRALEEKVAKEGYVLTESQLKVMEKRELEKVAQGEIETEFPGYLGSQDTYFVGTVKGVGRIYQQTFVDCYAKIAICKLYTMKTALTAADLLNDRVLPFYEKIEVPLLRILTDRGSEYNGKPESHDYQLFLAINDIDHSRTKVRSPQSNGICERFHRTVLEEFYQVAFRKRLYNKLEELQGDLDLWLQDYNFNRTHQGKMCCGRTPMQTLTEDLFKAKNKMILPPKSQSHQENFRSNFFDKKIGGEA